MAKRLTHSAEELDSAVAQAAENSEYIAELRSSLDEKVDKQEGKGLSTEDYTTADKEKLAGLENYDDTELRAEVAAAAEQAALNRSALDYQRKNLLKNTAVSKTINGVDFTVNEDKTVTVNGTASEQTPFIIANTSWLKDNIPSGRYTLSGCPAGGSTSTYRFYAYKGNGTASYTDVGNGITGEFNYSSSNTPANIAIVIGAGVTVNNLIFKPMLRYAEISDDTYEPYKPSIEERLAALEEKFAATEGGT